MTRAGESAGADDLRERSLVWLGMGSAFGYALLTWLSGRFGDGTADLHRPTLWMLAIFVFQFALYWTALWLALRSPPSKRLVRGIVIAACGFRAILLPSTPIHEIDAYRYIWDGAVGAVGVSAYLYTPQQVRDAIHLPSATLDEDLRRLVTLQARSKSLATSLEKVHYANLPSPYPSVSQAVFTLAAIITPDGASTHARLVVLKFLLVLFDLGTLLVVIALLREVGLHPGWSLTYGWCPLVVKEIANSGHLDSIAIFFTSLAVWLLVRTCRDVRQRPKLASIRPTIAVAGALALGIGAKLYPIVLIPLFAAIWWRQRGLVNCVTGIATTGLLTLALLLPMIPTTSDETDPAPTVPQLAIPGQTFDLLPPATRSVEPSAGINAFLSHWEMNDLIFMVVLENLRPQAEVEPYAKPWFAVVPDSWSQRLIAYCSRVSRRLGKPSVPTDSSPPVAAANSSFALARVITGGAFLVFACTLAWIAAGCRDPQLWCRAVLLTLAWFWLTCPTQNPWYWCWVMPFLPFARYRTWHAVAACTMLYYLRFWFAAQFPDPPTLGTPYDGSNFFYFVVVWIEFAPVLLLLGVECSLNRRRRALTAPPRESSDL